MNFHAGGKHTVKTAHASKRRIEIFFFVKYFYWVFYTVHENTFTSVPMFLLVKNITRSKMSRSKIVPVKNCPGQKMSRSKYTGQNIPVRVSRSMSKFTGQKYYSVKNVPVKNCPGQKMSRSKTVSVKKCLGQKKSRSKYNILLIIIITTIS